MNQLIKIVFLILSVSFLPVKSNVGKIERTGFNILGVTTGTFI